MRLAFAAFLPSRRTKMFVFGCRRCKPKLHPVCKHIYFRLCGKVFGFSPTRKCCGSTITKPKLIRNWGTFSRCWLGFRVSVAWGGKGRWDGTQTTRRYKLSWRRHWHSYARSVSGDQANIQPVNECHSFSLSLKLYGDLILCILTGFANGNQGGDFVLLLLRVGAVCWWGEN